VYAGGGEPGAQPDVGGQQTQLDRGDLGQLHALQYGVHRRCGHAFVIGGIGDELPRCEIGGPRESRRQITDPRSHGTQVCGVPDVISEYVECADMWTAQSSERGK